MKEFKRSQEWLERAKEVIPFPYNQTFSKGPSQYVQGVSPVFVDWGSGCYLYDVDGNKYIDLVMGLMPLILGYTWFDRGRHYPIYSLPNPSEVELSELLCEVIPCAEMVRLGKNGSDATTAAVRLARAITGKYKVACCGYHGWHDWYVGTTGRDKGVPALVAGLTRPFEYNNLEQLKKILELGDTACVIMEPVNFVKPVFMNVKEDSFGSDKMGGSFLSCVKYLCSKHNALLIFDEMITGFRWSLGGAQEYFDVIPDLACFGKAMANGWPISAVVGRKEIMKEFGNVHFSSTFGGEVLSIHAALTTINCIRSNGIVEHLWKIGEQLAVGMRELIAKYDLLHYVRLEGDYDIWTRLWTKDNLVKSFISQELTARGILWVGSFNLSFAHKSYYIERVLEAFDEIFGRLSQLNHGDLKAEIKGIPIEAKAIRD